MLYDNNDCTMVKNFIEDNTDIALIYMLAEQEGDCREMVAFIQEYNLMGKYLVYRHIQETQMEE